MPGRSSGRRRTGPQPPYDLLDVDKKYSWLKAPRWNDVAVEVGPFAHVLAMYASGHHRTRELTNAVLQMLGEPISAVFSTLGRTAARAIETKVFADSLRTFYADLVAEIKAGNTRTFNDTRWDPNTWPGKAQGFGFIEAPRGALGHWIVIENGKIANYQMVVPTTSAWCTRSTPAWLARSTWSTPPAKTLAKSPPA